MADDMTTGMGDAGTPALPADSVPDASTETTADVPSVDPTEAEVTALFETDEEKTETETTFLDGRFKSREDFEKSYSALEAKLKERADALDDDTLRAAAKDRGFLHEVPDQYEGVAEVMQEAGIKPAEADDPSWSEFYDEAKAQGLTQDQMNWMIKFGGDWVNQSIQQHLAEYGPTVDREGEIAKLSQEWGDKTESRGKEIMQWASANLPRDLLTKPLISSAAGMKALYQHMNGQRGAQPIPEGTRTSSISGMEMDAKVDELMKSDAYRHPHNPNHSAIHKQVDQLLAQLVRK